MNIHYLQRLVAMNNLKKYCVVCGFLFILLVIYNLPVVDDEIVKNKEIVNSGNISSVNGEVVSTNNNIDELRTRYNNSDIVAVLRIENTDLESIVVKAGDNDYYLDHNLYKQIDKVGSTFMDYRNNIDDKKILIYGHNSKTINTEFHVLESYLDSSFYQTHKKIELELENKKYTYNIFSIMIVKEDYQHMKLNFSIDEWKSHLKFIKDNSIYNTNQDISINDDIIILQTCYYNPSDSYLLVVGKKI